MVFPGVHEWAPAAVAEEAIEWLATGFAGGSHSIQGRPGSRRLAELDSIRADGDTGEMIRRFDAWPGTSQPTRP